MHQLSRFEETFTKEVLSKCSIEKLWGLEKGLEAHGIKVHGMNTTKLLKKIKDELDNQIGLKKWTIGDRLITDDDVAGFSLEFDDVNENDKFPTRICGKISTLHVDDDFDSRIEQGRECLKEASDTIIRLTIEAPVGEEYDQQRTSNFVDTFATSTLGTMPKLESITLRNYTKADISEDQFPELSQIDASFDVISTNQHLLKQLKWLSIDCGQMTSAEDQTQIEDFIKNRLQEGKWSLALVKIKLSASESPIVSFALKVIENAAGQTTAASDQNEQADESLTFNNKDDILRAARGIAVDASDCEAPEGNIEQILGVADWMNLETLVIEASNEDYYRGTLIPKIDSVQKNLYTFSTMEGVVFKIDTITEELLLEINDVDLLDRFGELAGWRRLVLRITEELDASKIINLKENLGKIQTLTHLKIETEQKSIDDFAIANFEGIFVEISNDTFEITYDNKTDWATVMLKAGHFDSQMAIDVDNLNDPKKVKHLTDILKLLVGCKNMKRLRLSGNFLLLFYHMKGTGDSTFKQLTKLEEILIDAGYTPVKQMNWYKIINDCPVLTEIKLMFPSQARARKQDVEKIRKKGLCYCNAECYETYQCWYLLDISTMSLRDEFNIGRTIDNRNDLNTS